MSSPSVSLADLPRELALLRGARATSIDTGQSEAAVWRLDGLAEVLFLKSELVHALAELPNEVARLDWLETAKIAAPRRRAWVTTEGRHWLVMSTVPGVDLTHLTHDVAAVTKVLATGLRHLHNHDIAGCPFNHRLEQRLVRGAANLAAGRVDETDFDDARAHWAGVDVWSWLEANRPEGEDLVVAHGDASLPNVMAEDGQFGGFVDCGRLGVADRWQDLAIACRSIIFTCGADHVAAFLEAYGAPWDQARYDYYCTLDELF